MKSTYKNLIYLIVLVVIILSSIFVVIDFVHFYFPLSHLTIDPTVVCDKSCIEKIENYDGRCYEINLDEFVCRHNREFSRGDNNVKSISAMPVTYGEIVLFPQGESDERYFSIGDVNILDKVTKRIQVDFKHIDKIDTQSFLTSELTPGDTFVSPCKEGSNSIHIVEYVDLVLIEETWYAEFWGIHSILPKELVSCDTKKIIERSLGIDYNLNLPEYDDKYFTAYDEYKNSMQK
jgi:hypothetical protein